MHWNPITELSQLDEIVVMSQQAPVVIFKHSTRCSISATALNRFERAWGDLKNPTYLLDLIAYRPISAEIAEKFNVAHESPQVLIIDKGNCSFSATHWDISVEEIRTKLIG